MLKRLMFFIKPTTMLSAFRIYDLTSEATSKNRKEWRSLSKTPRFIFERPLPKGWYVIEVAVRSKEPINSKVHISDLVDINKQVVLPLILKNTKVSKLFFYAESELSELRFDPLETEGVFNLTEFTVKAVTESFALKRMNNFISNAGIKPIECGLFRYKTDFLIAIYEAYLGAKAKKHARSLSYQQWLTKEAALPSPKVVQSSILFSVVIPVYKPVLKLFKQSVNSILQQTYSNFEVCIADDASCDDELRDYLTELEQDNSKIKIEFRNKNGHISSATNSALSLATGDFIVFMDHDDLLAKDALAWLAKEIAESPDVKLLYTDEDKIDSSGNRYEPHFKPKFSPSLLLGQNYISHLTAMTKTLVDELGGLRIGYEGAQDHDLLIRALPYLNSKNVMRIPRVLYHWRAIEGSTASTPDAKSYTNHAAVRSVQEYLDRHEPEAIAKPGLGPNTVKIERPILIAPLVSILIPTRDGLDVLKPCVESILTKSDYTNFEIIILDNDSKEADTHTFFKEIQSRDDRVSVMHCPGEFNFSRINNLGVDCANGEYIALINNDIEVINSHWLTEMVSLAQLDDVGCVGAKLLYSNGTIQHGGVILGIGGIAGHSHLHYPGATSGYFERMNLVHEVSAVTAACLLVKRSIYKAVGGLDESLKVAFNDVDFCIKVREQGYRNLFTPYAELYHHESVSRGYEDTPEKQARFRSEVEKMQEKWGELLFSDPYYNPNFDLTAEPYSIV